MVVAHAPRSSQPRPRRWRSALNVLVVIALVGVVVPVAANHVQGTGTGSPFTAQFVHGGDNEWWVEFEARAGGGGSIFLGQVQVEGSSHLHGMNFAANTFERQQQGWQKFAPEQAFQVPPGKRVMFHVSMSDAAGNKDVVTSCWFTHPAGVEQCGDTSTSSSTTTSSSSTTTTSSSTTTSGTTFNAPFTGFRGNEWWVQANVGTNGPVIAKVEVRTLANCGDSVCASSFKPLSKQSWGPTAWAGSYHFPQGSILQMRATATTGQTDLSSCRQWIPASGQDAQIVACPTGGTQPKPFDATFTGVKGNNWWVQASVAANEPLAGVDVRVNCAPSWRPLAKQSYGWSASFNIPSGAKVDFMARSTDGDVDVSGGYTWTAATPASGCAIGAWPKEGSRASYHFNSGVCGGGECMHASADLDLVYRAGRWTGVCNGVDEHSFPDGTRTTEAWTDRLDGVAPPFQTAKAVGAQFSQRDFETRFGSRTCEYVVGPTLTVERQELYQTTDDANGNPRYVQVWLGLRDVEQENRYDAHFDTRLGMVLQSADHPRRSAQGSNWMVLMDTDAPLAYSSVVA